jgi:hypothetical protein
MKAFLGSFVLVCILVHAAMARPMEKQPAITLTHFSLTGDLSGGDASFTLTAMARVENSKGGSLELLSGTVALTAFESHLREHLHADQNRFILTFDRGGEFPIQVKFKAAVHQTDEWNSVDFHVAPSVLQPIVLRGLASDTQFQFTGAARPERKENDFLSYLPSDGAVKLSWKEGRPETEGKLFFSTGMLSQISVGPGLMRQVALFDFKVMQGELSQISMRVRGAGEITRVQGDQVLAWNVEPLTNSSDRRLTIQLNQPQKDQFALQIQAQTPLDAFPQTADVLELRPENATRFSGYLRLVNDGAVRLEVVKTEGTSQISPDQFPETEKTRAAFRLEGNQRFAYRFAGGTFALRFQADQILPEVAVSELLGYRAGENELTLEAQLELDIQDAPLRELVIGVPKGYAVARLNAASLSDYFLTEPAGASLAELRLVYSQPISGRQLVELRLEHNQGLQGTNWTLPRLEIAQAKSVRGFVGVATDAGFRVTPERTKGLTDIAMAFYPGKLEGIQAAFHLSETAWEAAMRVERLPQTIQASALHLFSIGEGIAYGSSVINYVVSGAPVAAFKLELSGEYFNVEFTGKDLRSWQKIPGGYLVQLQTPVSGAYTLLATYERPFKPQGEPLAFTGARPMDAQSEEGYTLITSAYQFEVKPVDVSSRLIQLEPAEVPPEDRLFFDAPVLAAYRYASRPFDLKLSLSPLRQGDSVSQIVDRALLDTRVSKEGQVVTDIRYFIKNRGNPHFRLTIPDGSQLWSATINGTSAVPVQDGKSSLIPLPQSSDPNAVLELDLKLASQSADPRLIQIAAPTSDAPVMLADWKIEPDTGRRLVFEKGSIRPADGSPDTSGFAQLARLFSSGNAQQTLSWLCAVLALAAGATAVWNRTAHRGAYRIGAATVFIAFALIFVCFLRLQALADSVTQTTAPGLTFLAPGQQAGTALSVVVSNVADTMSLRTVMGCGWPALAGLALWLAGSRFGRVGWACGWLLLAWAALRFPNGASLFFWVLFLFLAREVLVPVLAQLWRSPRGTIPLPTPAATALIVGGCLWLAAGVPLAHGTEVAVVADSVTQTVRVEGKVALGATEIHWQAIKGQALPLFTGPAVLTHLSYPARSLELVSQKLVARTSGMLDIQIQYQSPVKDNGFLLPVPPGLINQLNLTVIDLDVDVLSAQAVSIHCDHVSSNTLASLVLSPAEASITWQPRRRDVKTEKPVFYAELSQLYAPLAGVIEGAHAVSIRPAQGELSELILNVPPGATITDVVDPSRLGGGAGSLVSLWRFDPGTGKLRVTLNPAQSRPFAILVRSQIAAAPLPFEQSAGLVTVENAAGQIGWLGIATGNEVQLENVAVHSLSPINLEDFPNETVAALQGQTPDLTLRRAFRYSDTNASVVLRAAAVEPDVRVETDDTLSLGEDRIVLADNFTVDITRAGIFELSFLMPPGFDVESISSPVLSQWTELKTDAGRVITLHLTGKTQGRHSFILTLSGPGVKTARAWKVPQVVLRQASKQRGTLLVVPEQGMRLQVVTREGYTQLDPQQSGIQQKGVLGFRALQVPANLVLDIEQVDPWVQVTSLQHAAIGDAQIKVTANLQYQIENTGLKTFRVLLPANAEGVQFQGEQVADFLQSSGTTTNGLRPWEIKLRRRVIGPYLLQAAYQILLPSHATETTLRGVEAGDVNLQRGFVTVQSDPRLQVTVDSLPEALQPAEWQSIPPNLQKDLQTVAANFTYRLVYPSFQLRLKLERHEATKLLPARVNNITFQSVISDDGNMLTRTRLEILPGDKRLLSVALPPGARFWFAFVNNSGVWPWRNGDKLLIPLEQQSAGDKPVAVEIFHSGRAGEGDARSLDLDLLAPKFDLPLENITWKISLSGKWRVKHWSGSLQLQQEQVIPRLDATDTQGYLQNETNLQSARTAQAEQFLDLGNHSLAQGDPQEARRAFEAAYGLSTQDAAFNEDARVQLHNIKLQQALIGLNAGQSAAVGDPGALGGKLRDLRAHKEMNYTQQDARDIIDINTADENAAFLHLAEKLIQQQDVAVNTPAGIHASMPEEGRVLTFTRDVAVEPWADLKVGLRASMPQTASIPLRIAVLMGVFLVFAIFGVGLRPEVNKG